jgi:hypothetical protein
MAFEKNAFGLDLCGYNKFVEYSKIPADFIIPRIGNGCWIWKNVQKPNIAIDTTFHMHVQGAYDNNMMCGGYWVIDPTVDIDPNWSPSNPLTDRQVAPIWTACKDLVGKSLQFIAIDLEIYKNYLSETLTDYNITQPTKTLIKRLHQLWPDLKIGVYTGAWFVDQYAPSMKVWMDSMKSEEWFFVWLASYPYDKTDPAKPVKMLWSEWRTKHAPVLAPGKSFPWLSNRMVDIWQYSGDTHMADGFWGELEHSYSWLDLNVYEGTAEEMKIWCGYKGVLVPPPVVVPPVEVPVTLESLAKRVKVLEDKAGIK